MPLVFLPATIHQKGMAFDEGDGFGGRLWQVTLDPVNTLEQRDEKKVDFPKEGGFHSPSEGHENREHKRITKKEHHLLTIRERKKHLAITNHHYSRNRKPHHHTITKA